MGICENYAVCVDYIRMKIEHIVCCKVHYVRRLLTADLAWSCGTTEGMWKGFIKEYDEDAAVNWEGDIIQMLHL